MLERFATKIWRIVKKIGIGRVFDQPLIKNNVNKTIDLFAGKNWYFFPQDSWGFKLRFMFGWFEPQTVKTCREIIKPGMNVLDIGAHIGYFSRLFSELTGGTGRVFAFEPHPLTYDLLLKNINSCKCKNIIPIPKALSDKNDTVDFFETADSGKHSFFRVFESLSRIDSKGYAFKNKLIVNAIKLDDFLLKIGNPEINFIKMDIEGAEPKALRGMERTVKRSKNLVMIVEINSGTLNAGGVNVVEFLRQLENMNFKIQRILDSEGKIKSIEQLKDSRPEDGYVNLLCLKR